MFEPVSKDRIGSATRTSAALGGAAAGLAAAPALAASAGATAIPLVTSFGSLVGLSITAATPIGWLIALGIGGSAVALGACKLLQGASEVDAEVDIRWRRKHDDAARFDRFALAAGLQPIGRDQLRVALHEAVNQGHISADQGNRLLREVAQGTLTAAQVKQLLPP